MQGVTEVLGTELSYLPNISVLSSGVGNYHVVISERILDELETACVELLDLQVVHGSSLQKAQSSSRRNASDREH